MQGRGQGQGQGQLQAEVGVPVDRGRPAVLQVLHLMLLGAVHLATKFVHFFLVVAEAQV